MTDYCPTCRRPMHRRHTLAQQQLFHVLCAELGRDLGYTPSEMKMVIKRDFYGGKLKGMNGLLYVEWYETAGISLDDYSDLIEHVYFVAAWNGYVFAS